MNLNFTQEQAKMRERIVMLTEMLGEQQVQAKPCALLLNQLLEVRLLTSRIEKEAGQLYRSLKGPEIDA